MMPAPPMGERPEGHLPWRRLPYPRQTDAFSLSRRNSRATYATASAVAASTRHDGGPPVLLDHHPVAALVVLEIGPIAFPGPGHAVVVERRLAMRHPRLGPAHHRVGVGSASDGESDE
jgi:hypothetical protein